MAMPSILVSARRATSENVMALILDDGGGVDFHQPFGSGQRLHHQPGQNCLHALNILSHGAVNRLAVARVGNVDNDLDQMRHLATRFLDQLLDVLHDLAGLLNGFVTVEIDGVIEFLRALPQDPDCFAAMRGSRLTQVLVQCLLWIGIAGVKGANAGSAISVSLSRVDFCDQVLRKIVVWTFQMAKVTGGCCV